MTTQTDLFILVLLGTSRDGRRSEHVARLVFTELGRRENLPSEVLDLADFDFPAKDSS